MARILDWIELDLENMDLNKYECFLIKNGWKHKSNPNYPKLPYKVYCLKDAKNCIFLPKRKYEDEEDKSSYIILLDQGLEALAKEGNKTKRKIFELIDDT